FDFDATTLYAEYGGALRLPANSHTLFLRGTTTNVLASGTNPGPRPGYIIELEAGTALEAISTCFAAANQARLASGRHTFRVNLYMDTPMLIDTQRFRPTQASFLRCAIDP